MSTEGLPPTPWDGWIEHSERFGAASRETLNKLEQERRDAVEAARKADARKAFWSYVKAWVESDPEAMRLYRECEDRGY